MDDAINQFHRLTWFRFSPTRTRTIPGSPDAHLVSLVACGGVTYRTLLRASVAGGYLWPVANWTWVHSSPSVMVCLSNPVHLLPEGSRGLETLNSMCFCLEPTAPNSHRNSKNLFSKREIIESCFFFSLSLFVPSCFLLTNTI